MATVSKKAMLTTFQNGGKGQNDQNDQIGRNAKKAQT